MNLKAVIHLNRPFHFLHVQILYILKWSWSSLPEIVILLQNDIFYKLLANGNIIIVFLTNIRLSRKKLPKTKTPAYFAAVAVTKKKVLKH
jgi:hypothetical protein